MESTRQILVQRSLNLFVPFCYPTGNYATGTNIAFSSDPTMFATIEANGNIHIHGTKSKKDSGYVLLGNESGATKYAMMHETVLQAGETYSYSYNITYGNASLQYIDSTDSKRKTVLSGGVMRVTPTIDITIKFLYIDIYKTSDDSNIGKTYDFYLSPMVVEGPYSQSYTPYYQEYEATVQRLVRRSNNLFLPFSSESRSAIGKDLEFSSDPTLFAAIMNDGNIHIHGTKSVQDSGYVLLWSLTQQLVLKAGSTYNLSVSATAHTQFILQSDQSGTRTNIMQVNPTFTNGLTKTMTEDTTITHVFMNISGATPINIGDTVDEYVNPMLVEQGTRMDYEPYYKEYTSTSMQINDFYPTGYIVNSNGVVVKNLVDFNALIPNKYLNNEDKVSDNGIWGYIAEYYPCDGNARYYFGMLDKNDGLLKHMLLHFYNEDKTIISTAQVLTRDGGDNMLDSLSPSNSKYMRVTMDRLDDKSSNSFPKFPYLYKQPTA